MKDVKGFEKLYSANEDGFIFSYYSNRYLKGVADKDGYLRVTLHKDKKQYNRTVHRLVLSAFIVNKTNKPEVNHINGIKDDNRLSNLEWCTASENSKHAHSLGLRPLTEKQSKARRLNMLKINKNKTEKQRKYNREMVSKANSKRVINNITKDVYDSALELSNFLGINYSTLKWRIKHNECEYSYVIR